MAEAQAQAQAQAQQAQECGAAATHAVDSTARRATPAKSQPLAQRSAAGTRQPQARLAAMRKSWTKTVGPRCKQAPVFFFSTFTTGCIARRQERRTLGCSPRPILTIPQQHRLRPHDPLRHGRELDPARPRRLQQAVRLRKLRKHKDYTTAG